MQGQSVDEILRRWDAAIRAECRDLPDHIKDTGTVLRAPAAPEAIASLEQRLGVALPPSYRAFLERSDGAFAQPGAGVMAYYGGLHEEIGGTGLGLLDSARVGWCRELDPASLDIATYDGPPAFETHGAEAGYLLHADELGADEPRADHMRYSLLVAEAHPSLVLLNPLVVDQHGEWEAWIFDFHAGCRRYRSFAAALTGDTALVEKRVASTRSAEALRAVANDESLPERDRYIAAKELDERGFAEHAAPALIALINRGTDENVRQEVARVLSRINDADAVAAVLDLTRQEGVPPRLISAAVHGLASSSHEAARDRALELLVDPGVSTWTIKGVYRDGRDVLWEAWERTRDIRILVQFARYGDKRVIPAYVEALRDPTADDDVIRELLSCATYWRDESVIDALIELADRDPRWLESIGRDLLHLGRERDGIELLARAQRSPRGSYWAAEQIAWRRTPQGEAVLLGLLRDAPDDSVVSSLGWVATEPAAAALRRVARHEPFRAAALDGLEKMHNSFGRDALLSLISEDDHVPLRMLARQRDERVRGRLLYMLGEDDDDIVRMAAECLRDLRDTTTAPELLATMMRTDDEDVQVILAHALVMMRVPQATAALDVLDRSGDDEVRELAASWR